MRVAVLAHSFPRFAGDTHGPFVKHLSEALARRGHEVRVLIPHHPEIRPDPQTPLSIEPFRYAWPDGLEVLGYSRTLKRDVGLKLAATLVSPLYFAFAERALRRQIVHHRIELVHAHWILPNGFVAARAAAAHGIPVVVTLHGSDVFMAERNPLFRALATRALAGAAHVTSCSAELSERLLRLGGEEHRAKVLLVPNGTEVVATERAPAVAAIRRRHGCAETDRLVVAVGRLVDKKGFGFLLEAMPVLLSAEPRAKLLLGGGGGLEGELRAQAARLGVAERVVFTGALSHPEALELVAAGEVFVMPSIRDPKGNVDGLPIVVLEAMAAGRPVVGTAVSGLPLAVLEGETGLLVPEQDPAALAQAVTALLADPERARAMGQRGARRVQDELNWDAVAAIHDRLYRQAAKEPAKKPAGKAARKPAREAG